MIISRILSASQLKKYDSCPRAWYYYTNDYPRTDERYDGYAECGKAVHEAVQHVITKKEWDGLDRFALKRRLDDAMMDRFDKQIEGFKRIYPQMTFVKPEVEVEITGEINGLPFKGFLDVLDGETIIDIKPRPTPGDKIQSEVYRTLYRQKHGVEPTIYFIYLLEGNVVKMPQSPDAYTEILVQKIKDEASRGVFPKNKSDFCSRFCEYQTLCDTMR